MSLVKENNNFIDHFRKSVNGKETRIALQNELLQKFQFYQRSKKSKEKNEYFEDCNLNLIGVRS